MSKITIPVLTHHKRKSIGGRPSGSEAAVKKLGRPTSKVLQAMNNLRDMVAVGHGDALVKKALEIALNDKHAHQGLMLRMLIEKVLPIDMFKDVLETPEHAISVTITETDGRTTEVKIGGEPEPDTFEGEITDVHFDEEEATDGDEEQHQD